MQARTLPNSEMLAAATRRLRQAAEAEAALLLLDKQAEVALLLDRQEEAALLLQAKAAVVERLVLRVRAAELELRVLAAQAEVELPVAAKVGEAAVRVATAMQARAACPRRVLKLQVHPRVAPVERAQAARVQAARVQAESPAIQWQARAASLA